MIKNSIENLITLLEEEEAAEARKKPKIVKLADPTIFTITSPSQWQRNKLRSRDFNHKDQPPANYLDLKHIKMKIEVCKYR